MNEIEVKDKILQFVLSNPKAASYMLYYMSEQIEGEWGSDFGPDGTYKQFNQQFDDINNVLKHEDSKITGDIRKRRLPIIKFTNETWCPKCKEWRSDSEFRVYPETNGKPLFHVENTKLQCWRYIIGYTEPRGDENVK